MPRRAREPSLRNSAISLRNFGRRSASWPVGIRFWWTPRGLPEVSANRPKRLFTKNTGLC